MKYLLIFMFMVVIFSHPVSSSLKYVTNSLKTVGYVSIYKTLKLSKLATFNKFIRTHLYFSRLKINRLEYKDFKYIFKARGSFFTKNIYLNNKTLGGYVI